MGRLVPHPAWLAGIVLTIGGCVGGCDKPHPSEVKPAPERVDTSPDLRVDEPPRVRTPVHHRTSAKPCASNVGADGGVIRESLGGRGRYPRGAPCTADGCAKMPLAASRCVDKRCVIDGCSEDSECSNAKSGELSVCGCDTLAGNRCLAVGNCRTDASCKGRGCSPSAAESCSNLSGIVGYFCHTADDTCVDDADCRGDAGSEEAMCVFHRAKGRWACSAAACDG